MNQEDRDVRVMKQVAPTISRDNLILFRYIFNTTVKEYTTMKKFRKMNKNRRFSINVELITKKLLESEFNIEDQKDFSSDLKDLILERSKKL